MTAWKLTDGLQNLRAQVDATFPDRSHASDGTIGDTAHQAETSGHNPDDTPGSRPEWNGDQDHIPEVRAWDCTSDFGPGVDAQAVVDHIRALPRIGEVLRYMIYNRREYHERNGFAPTAYTGASPHTEHIHFSGAWTQAADNNTAFNFHLEDLVSLSADDRNWLAGLVNGLVANTSKDKIPETPVGHLVLSQGIPDGTAGGERAAAWEVLENLGTTLVALQKQVAAIGAPDPAVLAQAIAAAIPADLAGRVADVLAQRLSA